MIDSWKKIEASRRKKNVKWQKLPVREMSVKKESGRKKKWQGEKVEAFRKKNINIWGRKKGEQKN